MRGIEKQELNYRAEVVAKEHDGILPYCKTFYHQSIIYSSERSYDAFKRFDISFSSGDEP